MYGQLMGRRRCSTQMPCMQSSMLFVVLLGLSIEEALGAPSTPFFPSLARRQSSSSHSGSDTSSNGGISPQVWIPAVVIILVLLAVFCFMWTRKGFLDRLRGVTSSAANSTPSAATVQARELTADQLTNGNGTSTTNDASTRGTRPRRTRRTPSQISTKSLPVYMKEPGDHELVIFRGPSEMEDPLRPGIPEEQDGPETEEMREARIHPPPSAQRIAVLPSIAQSTYTLDLNPDESGEQDSQDISGELALVGEDDPSRRESVGATTHRSIDSSDSMTGLMLRQQRLSDEIPDEDAPPYSPAAGDAAVEHHLSPTSSGLEHDVPSPPGLSAPPAGTSGATVQHDEPIAREGLPASQSAFSNRSVRGLRGLGNLFTFGGQQQQQQGSPASQSGAGGSAARTLRTSPSVTFAANLPSTTSPAAASSVSVSNPPVSGTTRHHRHRSSQSGGSTSTINLPLLRAVSRQRSNNTLNSSGVGASSSRLNLTSPSMLSINSISAPLTHTVVRTDIRYPPGGPTPEQIKLISSREGLERFGVPYGKDAVEHAEASRLDLPLEPPPRVFEDDEAGSTDGEAEADEELQEPSRNRSPPRAEHTQEASLPITHTTVPQLLVPIFM